MTTIIVILIGLLAIYLCILRECDWNIMAANFAIAYEVTEFYWAIRTNIENRMRSKRNGGKKR